MGGYCQAVVSVNNNQSTNDSYIILQLNLMHWFALQVSIDDLTSVEDCAVRLGWSQSLGT